jgi:hypothetical protein
MRQTVLCWSGIVRFVLLPAHPHCQCCIAVFARTHVWHSSFTAQGTPRDAPGCQFRAAHTAWYYMLLLCWAAANLCHSTTRIVIAVYDSSALYFAQR